MSDVSLIVEGSYPYVTGGVSAWTQSLIEGLPEVTFSLVHLGEPGETRYRRPRNLVEVVDVPVDPETGEAACAMPEASVYHALATGAAGTAAARAAKQHGRRFVLSEHGLAWLEARFGISGCKRHDSPNPELVERQAREAYRTAFAITSVCESNARLQRSLGAERVSVIPNAVPLPDSVTLSRAEPVVGFVGRVVRVKDVETFLRASRIVANALPLTRFVVVGPLDHEPGYAARCRALADELSLDVEFAGETDPAAWYPRLDALVLTSRSEAQPLVALEAMAAGVPVVATAVGGCADLLRRCGLVTAPRDPAATAAAVLRLLRDSDLHTRLAHSGRAQVARDHAPARTLASFAELYEAAA